MNEIELREQGDSSPDTQQPKAAQCCPVCNGKGKVPNGFYAAIGSDTWSTSSTTPEVCRSCNGAGVVWSN